MRDLRSQDLASTAGIGSPNEGLGRKGERRIGAGAIEMGVQKTPPYEL